MPSTGINSLTDLEVSDLCLVRHNCDFYLQNQIECGFIRECTTNFAPATIAPVINANVKRTSNPNPNPNLNPYPTPNQKANHYPHSNSLLPEISWQAEASEGSEQIKHWRAKSLFTNNRLPLQCLSPQNLPTPLMAGATVAGANVGSPHQDVYK